MTDLAGNVSFEFLKASDSVSSTCQLLLLLDSISKRNDLSPSESQCAVLEQEPLFSALLIEFSLIDTDGKAPS